MNRSVPRFPVMMILSLLAGLAVTTGSARAQTLTPAMVEAHIKEWIAAWASNNPQRIVTVDPPANGFGVRTLAFRPAGIAPSAYLNAVKSFFAGLDYYRAELNEVHTAVDGDIGLAWGFYTESFKSKGESPEKIRIRFTSTMRYDRAGWRTLLYHRDVQKFDQLGRYIPQR